MPYGFPWEATREPKGYRCPVCNETNWGQYSPFCAQCGRPLPPQERLVLTGYAEQYDRMLGLGREPDEIKRHLTEIGEVEIWLQMYCASHRETELRFRRQGGRFNGDFTLICGGTFELHLPVDNGWTGQLSISVRDDVCHVEDASVNALITCCGTTLFEIADRTT